MYSKIMVPVDLAHADKLDKALDTAAGLAKQHGAAIILAGVTPPAATPVAHNPAEYDEKLAGFAAAQSKSHAITMSPLALTGHDPVRDLDTVLMKAIDDEGADLVVMASHLPGLKDHIFASNAGYLASHAPVSVFVVR